MKLIVGLGNPGPKYETTRHNAGFLVLDELADEWGIALEKNKRGDFEGSGTVFGAKVLLLKPMTFMNLSGKAISPIAQFFKLKEQDLIVLHDDIDVPTGKVKARIGGGPGGHNGIRSIIAETGFKEFDRIKIGVGRPQNNPNNDGEGYKQEVHDWVLGPLSESELLSYQKQVKEDVVLRLKNILAKIS